MNDISLKIIYSERFRDHDTGSHPENARRMQAAGTLREHLHSDRVADRLDPQKWRICSVTPMSISPSSGILRSRVVAWRTRIRSSLLNQYEVLALRWCFRVDSLCHNQDPSCFRIQPSTRSSRLPRPGTGFCLLNTYRRPLCPGEISDQAYPDSGRG